MDDKQVFVSMLKENTRKMNKEGKKFHQYLSALITTIGASVIGTVLGWTSPMVPILGDKNNTNVPLHLTPDEAAWVGSLAAIGAIVGALPAGYFANKIGRKMTFILFSVPWIGSWILILIATSPTMLYVSRFISGVVVGVMSTVIPVYIGEIAEDSIRGALGTTFQLCLNIGILFSYLFGMFESYHILAIACTALTVAFLVGVIFIPESPTHLISKQNTIAAEGSLRRLRGKKFDIQGEIDEISRNLSSSGKSRMTFSQLFTLPNVKAMIVSFGLMIFQQQSGINAVVFYSVEIFKHAGSTLAPTVCSVIVGVVMVVFTVVSGILVDRAGRKILLLLSDIVMAIALAVLGYYFYLKEQGQDVTSIGWIPLLCVVIYVIVFSLGFGPIPWMMSAEVLPPSIKGFATGVAVALNWFQTFLVTRFFVVLLGALGASKTYWLFSIICVIGTFFIIFLVPETKGKSVQEIREIFEGKSAKKNKTINGL